jgi:hypothetical protein
MAEREKRIFEYRTFPVPDLVIDKRFNEEAQEEMGAESIQGHAAVFDTIGDGEWFREKIAPGAFANSILKDDIRALFNHDSNFILGRNKSGTLTLREDEKGLFVWIDPPNTSLGRDLKESIRRGDITQMSFGFEIIKEERQKGQNGEPDLFTLQEVKLWDVSPVTFPFYKETDVTVHSREAWAMARVEEERQKSVPVKKRFDLRFREFLFKYNR